MPKLSPEHRQVWLPWIASGLIQIMFVVLSVDAIPVGKVLLEFGIYVLLGALITFTTKSPWLKSPLLPAGVIFAGHLLQLKIKGLNSITHLIYAIGVMAVVLIPARLTFRWTKTRWWLSIPAAFLLTLLAQFFWANRSISPIENISGWFDNSSSDDTELTPIVFLTVDTLRADTVGQMQSWDFLSQRCATWENGMSSASWTLPALASLWTGKLPSEHGSFLKPNTEEDFQAIKKDVPLLSEQLDEMGYGSGAFLSNPFISRGLGFGRGFQYWVSDVDKYPIPIHLSWMGPLHTMHGDDGELIYQRSIKWLEQQEKSGFLLWAHYFDPHQPYRNSPDPQFQKHLLSTHRIGRLVPNENYLEDFIEAYENEVAYTDARVLKTLQKLDADGFFSRGILVFTVDHGEEFWDHGGFEHGHSHHTEVVDVPIAYCSTSTEAGPRTDLASIIDISSTIQAELGLSNDGIDLRQPIPSDRIASAVGNLYFEPQVSVRQGQTRIIRTFKDHDYELFEDEVITGQSNRALITQLEHLSATLPQLKTEGGNVDMDQLRSLGYIE
jgi:arylsulfatase A-like enzyme